MSFAGRPWTIRQFTAEAGEQHPQPRSRASATASAASERAVGPAILDEPTERPILPWRTYSTSTVEWGRGSLGGVSSITDSRGSTGWESASGSRAS